jgi:hypothetical protein
MNRFASVLFASSIAASVANADVVDLNPSRYGSTYRQTSGIDPRLFAKEPYSSLFVVRGGSNIHRGFQVFDLSAVPAGATITSVNLNFTPAVAYGSPDVEVWGGFQPGELAYDTYFSLQGLSSWTQVYADDSPFASMTTDGGLFGHMVLTTGNNGNPVSIDLSGAGGLAYFQSQVGAETLLFTRLAHDVDFDAGWHGSDGGTYPTLHIEYLVPAPGTVALLGLGGLALTRRRRR